MTRDELRSVFRDETALLNRAEPGKTDSEGSNQGKSKVSLEELDAFLASIDLERDGILAARDRIVAFLGLTVDQDDPVFGLPLTMTINDKGESVSIYERLVLALQPRSQTTETRRWVAPTKYSTGYVDVSHQTTYWDDVWFRLLFWGDSTERKFQWDCSRCRPGHRLIALFRNEDRAGVVNADTKTYWVERPRSSVAIGLAVLFGMLLTFLFALVVLLPSIERNGTSGFVMATVLGVIVFSVGWIDRSRGVAIENDVAKACFRLLGGEAPARKTARAWGIGAIVFAIWSVYLLIPSASHKAPPQQAVSSVRIPAPQTKVPKTKMPADVAKKTPAAVEATAPALGSVPMQKGYRNIKERCERYAVKKLVMNCVNSTLAVLLDPSRSQEWGQDLSESEREDLIRGVRIFLAEVQARKE